MGRLWSDLGPIKKKKSGPFSITLGLAAKKLAMPPALAFFEPEFTERDFFSGLLPSFGFSSFTELTEFDLTGSSEAFLVLAKAPSNAPVFFTYFKCNSEISDDFSNENLVSPLSWPSELLEWSWVGQLQLLEWPKDSLLPHAATIHKKHQWKQLQQIFMDCQCLQKMAYLTRLHGIFFEHLQVNSI